MKGDFSKLRFSPNKNYTSVLQQQGRVALDADQNEQCAINDYLRTTETVDVVGAVGGPIHDEGFKITVPGNDAIKIGKGRYYVEGILCENDQPLLYSDQPFLIDPNPTDESLLSSLQQGSISVIQVYLEVWRRLVTALDDPCLREPALGLADTTARLQTVWRVVAKGVTSTQTEPVNGTVAVTNGSATVTGTGTTFTTALKVGQQVMFAADTTQTLYTVNAIASDNILTLSANHSGATTASTTATVVQAIGGCCGSMHTGLVPEHDAGKLSAQTGAGSGNCSCQPTPAAGYLGLENQLYRVEIHQAGTESTATFKWSRENGSVVVAVTGVSGSQVYVDSLGPDANLGFAVFQWVEISDDTSQFGQNPNQPGDLYQIQSINPETLCLTMTQPVASVNPTLNARMRRWDQFGTSAGANGISLSAGSWLSLENGIQVEFSKGNYESGDHWLIPARTATGQIEWPPCNSDGNPFQPAYRTEIYLAPLACLQWDTQTEAVNVQDCRKSFYPLTELEPCTTTASCCTITVSPQDLAGNVTLQSIVDKAASPTMFVQAASPGASGNNITVQISNLSPNSTPPTFDLTVTETDVYRGLTTGQSTGIEGVIGDEETWLPNMGPLAHILVGSVNTNLWPANNQEVTLTGGKTGTAQGNIVDSDKKTLVFTLQARSAGADGDLTRATITNLDTTQDPPTFDLTLKWAKKLSRVSLATLFQQIQSNLSYEITAQPPATVSSVFPAAGVTMLTGGADANPSTGSNAVAAQAGIFGNPGKVCLQPGTYYLSAPLTLGADHSNITLECCGGPAILAAGPGWGSGGVLPQGLVLLNSANNITLSELGFSLPSPLRLVVGTTFLQGLAPTLLEGILGSAVTGGDKEVATLLGRLYVSVGLRHVDCCNLRVQNCCFEFPNEVGVDFSGALLVAGILASGENSGLNLLDNSFEGQVNVIATDDGFYQIRVGYLLAHSVTISQLSRLEDSRTVGQTDINELRPRVHEEGSLLPAVLQDASFQGNSFLGLEVPVLIFSACGAVALEDNIVRNCYSGPWIIARSSPPDPTQLAGTPDAAVDVLQDPMLEGALALAQSYPLPEGAGTAQAVTIPSANIFLSQPPFQNPALAFLNALLQLEVGIEQAASEASSQAALEGNPVSGPDLVGHVVNNKIATYALPAWADSTGPGLVIWGEDEDESTEVIVSSNRIECSSAPFVPTGLIVQVENCVMTGNLFFNDYNSTVNGSLFLAPLGPTNGPSVAVTGNLFNGNTNLSSLVTAAAQPAGAGNGTNKVFNTTLAQHPVQTSTVIVFEGITQVGNDNGGGTITGTGLSGTIDYGSGATSLTFTTAPPAGTVVTVSYYYSKWVPLNGP